MSTITKGTLVMTEHGLAWYEEIIELGEAKEHGLNHVIKLIGGIITGKFGVINAIPATRAQAEKKIKEMGWEFIPNWKFAKENNQYYLFAVDSTYYVFQEGGLSPKDFDTASAQLAEAILVAKLLNATKD
jgi:hypothetical protein